ncbi:MAG TPA: hypoxanthine phosphoribosyltransferase, partial [Gemmatimonadetes bacterium]|nr:hypoxanthine phosphoribosyltransferase [Gemmatimonadota bacterium]
MADLVRSIPVSLQVDFLIVSSYGVGKVSNNEVQLLYIPIVELKGRAVLVVEDIVDSGTTLSRLIPLIEALDPTSIEVCTLLHKRVAQHGLEPRWVGFDVPNEFLVGYGLDHGEDFR